jgi:hypothetical protein
MNASICARAFCPSASSSRSSWSRSPKSSAKSCPPAARKRVAVLAPCYPEDRRRMSPACGGAAAKRSRTGHGRSVRGRAVTPQPPAAHAATGRVAGRRTGRDTPPIRRINRVSTAHEQANRRFGIMAARDRSANRFPHRPLLIRPILGRCDPFWGAANRGCPHGCDESVVDGRIGRQRGRIAGRAPSLVARQPSGWSVDRIAAPPATVDGSPGRRR